MPDDNPWTTIGGDIRARRHGRYIVFSELGSDTEIMCATPAALLRAVQLHERQIDGLPLREADPFVERL